MNWNNGKVDRVNKILYYFICGGLHTGAGVLSENDKGVRGPQFFCPR